MVYNRRVRLAPIFRVSGYTFLDRALHFCCAAERSAFERYNKLLARKLGPYKVIGVSGNTQQILLD